MLDYVIRNATIYDGTGEPGYISDVGISKGKIVSIGNIEEAAHNIIDASGLILSPGFIDCHSHSDAFIFVDPDCGYKLKQGITLEINGQCGWSRAPFNNDMTIDTRKYLQSIFGKEGNAVPIFTSFAEQINAMKKLKIGIHQTCFVGHNVIRANVMGLQNRKSSLRELEDMKNLVEEAMQVGAQGMSSGLTYAPGNYSDIDELVELAKVVAKFDGIYTSHIRNEANGLLEAVDEAIKIARRAKVKTNISHMKALYEQNWEKLSVAISHIDAARKEGLSIFFDVYPYTASSCTILSSLPPSYISEGINKLIVRLSTTKGVAQLKSDIYDPYEKWENPIKNMGLDKFLIVGARNLKELVGKTIADYAKEKGMDEIEAYAYAIVKTQGEIIDIRFAISEDNIEMLYRHPSCMVGTDGLYMTGYNLSHPRSFGTFPRFLSRFVRDKGILSLEEAIHRITAMPAKVYNIHGKGQVKVGMDADLTIFDYKTLVDHADYLNPFSENQGIKAVFVGGELALKDNVIQDVRNGMIIRR